MWKEMKPDHAYHTPTREESRQLFHATLVELHIKDVSGRPLQQQRVVPLQTPERPPVSPRSSQPASVAANPTDILSTSNPHYTMFLADLQFFNPCAT